MKGRAVVAVAASLLLQPGCTRTDASPEPAPPLPAAATVTVLARASATVTGQPLGIPSPPWEAVMSVPDLPPGGALPMHRHPWPRYVYVERGRLRVSYEESGMVREFGAGEAVVEAIDQWHEGRVVGPEPVRLIVLDQLPPGETNVVRR